MSADMPNRFRDPTMRQFYDGAVHAFQVKHAIYSSMASAANRGSTGSSFASFFWRGYDGQVLGGGWDAASKKMVGYAVWRAGQDIAKAES